MKYFICSFQNSNYPTGYLPTTANTCTFTVNKVNDNICQLRCRISFLKMYLIVILADLTLRLFLACSKDVGQHLRHVKRPLPTEGAIRRTCPCALLHECIPLPPPLHLAFEACSPAVWHEMVAPSRSPRRSCNHAQ